jgi:hypothetical protein
MATGAGVPDRIITRDETLVAPGLEPYLSMETTLAAAPLPLSAWLVGSGLLCLSLFRCRRN